MKHTKGQWLVEIYSDDEVFSDEEREFNINIETDDNSTIIAKCGDEADAKLIAAAPELLAALLKLQQSLIDEYLSEDEADSLYSLAQTAIDKATE